MRFEDDRAGGAGAGPQPLSILSMRFPRPHHPCAALLGKRKTFNSLYEIPEEAFSESRGRGGEGLSILSMRFFGNGEYRFAVNVWEIPFNSLYEIPQQKYQKVVVYQREQKLSILSMRFFQGLTRSCLTYVACLSILSMRFRNTNTCPFISTRRTTFNSLYEIHLWVNAPDVLERGENFQFSL